jgi:eukaryotic-like serine/threonine-protein kinase
MDQSLDALLPALAAALGDGYTISRELRGGGMSRVFVAHDRLLSRDVAVKVLPSSLAEVVSVDRFNREIMVAAALQHPNIVPVLNAGEVDGLPFYVMPFISGESLRERINRGPLSVRETVSVMRDVARALAHAHEHGVVHRDIKPDNILLTTGAATVTDFGVAKALSASRGGLTAVASTTITGMGVSLGTPAYMAPEQIAADRDVDHRADLYALGVVAYEMLTGGPPFQGRSRQALLTAHLTETPPPLSRRRYDVPRSLDNLVMACLRKEPNTRPRSANDVVRTLEGPGVSADVATSTRPGGSRRLARRVGGLLLLAALMWGGWRWWPGRSAVPLPAAPASGSVAVLPLANLGDARADSMLAQGIASELLNAIVRIPGIRTASRTATAAVASQPMPPDAIARTLNVALLLEGDMQRQGARVRLRFRLVRARDDSTLWAGEYSQVVGDAFAIEDSVAHAVVPTIRRWLVGPPGAPGR